MIDTTSFEYSDSRWHDIHTHLKNSGFDVYSPGIKTGDCTSAYLVVKNAGSSQFGSFSTDTDLYTIYCYVPRENYSSLEPLVQRVKETMKGLEPMILSNHQQTPSFYDDSVKAHMISITYKNYKKS